MLDVERCHIAGVEHCGRQALKQRLLLCETVLQRHDQHPGVFTLTPLLLKQVRSPATQRTTSFDAQNNLSLPTRQLTSSITGITS